MKVLIADDEIHICSLLKYLIDWQGLGLEFGGSFSTGQAVLDYLARQEADILLCDIEMPGVNGIELMKALSQSHPALKVVVISGFRNFDYVRSALQYGASNYLLKPIDEKELNGVLRSIVTAAREDPVHKTMIMRASSRLQLLDEIRRPGAADDLAAVNRGYNYHFVPGSFQVLCAVFPGVEQGSDAPRLIMRMLEETLRPKLADFCQDFEFYREDTLHMAVLFNVESGGEQAVRTTLDGILHNAIVELGCKTQSEATIGVGRAASRFGEVYRSYQSARQVLCRRLYAPTQHILYAEFAPRRPAGSVELITAEEKRAIARSVEEIDPDGACAQVRQLFRRNERAFAADPCLVLECGRRVLQLLSNVMEELDGPQEEPGKFLREAELTLESSRTAQEVEDRLCALIGEQINTKLTKKLSNVAAYAQQAKGYIDRHYQENITLELLAGQLNINPAYLSVVFKNELGMNYSKYLTMVRMEKAKELLRRCDLNLTQVAHAVGYDRTAYFSSVFRAYAGIRPAEYQRLYQHGIGDAP